MRKLVLLIVLTFSFIFANPAGATKPPDHVITICHATDSNTNPYVVITVDVASTRFAGHEGHNGPVWNPSLKANHIKWGDIIPPTSNDGTRQVTPKNWGVGQNILENGCKIPSNQMTTTTVISSSSTTVGSLTTTTLAQKGSTTVPTLQDSSTSRRGSATPEQVNIQTDEILANTGASNKVLIFISVLLLLTGLAIIGSTKRRR